MPRRPPIAGRLDEPAVGELGQDEGDVLVVVVLEQALEGDGAELEVVVGAGAAHAGDAGQQVGVGIVELAAGSCRRWRQLRSKSTTKPLREREGADGAEGAAAGAAAEVVEAVVERDDAPEVEAAVGEAAAVLAFDQAGRRSVVTKGVMVASAEGPSTR